MINNFNNVFSKGFSTIEIIMNVSFILIIFLIIYIFYWHSINRNCDKCYNINNNDLKFYGDEFLVSSYNYNKDKDVSSITSVLEFPDAI